MQARKSSWLTILSLAFGVFGLSMGAQGQPNITAAAGYHIDNVPPAGVTPQAGEAVLSPAATNANTNVFNYQGILRKPDGTLASGTYTMTFALYSLPAGGNHIGHSELIPNVVVRDGLFNVLLGDKDAIADSVIAQSPLYLGIKVNLDVEMVPRQRIHAAPIALTLKPNATLSGLKSQNAGILVTDPQRGGISGDGGIVVKSATWDGFRAEGAQASGYASFNTVGDSFYSANGKHGLFVSGSRESGIWIQGAGDTGVVVDNLVNNGVSVSGYGGIGVVVWNPSRTPGNYSAQFDGAVWMSGPCYNCMFASLALNTSKQPLDEGDVIAANGIVKTDFLRQPLVGVAPASISDSVLGIVTSKAEIREMVEGNNKMKVMVPVSGTAQPGDYVEVVTSGLARVKVSQTVGVSSLGKQLTASANAGQAELARIDSNQRTAAISVIGTVLEVPKPGEELAWVFVSPR